jgi:predicted MPP superfamily phosphohydrolase
LPGLIGTLRPDAIVFTGDAINTQAGLEAARQTFREFASIAPMYGVRGNRDDILGDTDLFATTGVIELRGDAQRLVIRGDTLVFTGASRNRDWLRVRAALRQHAGAPFVVYLSHSPDAVEDVSRWGADLVLGGHTHGGQIALPGYGALWTGSRFGKRFEAGLYHVGATQMYINRGIGMEAVLPKLRVNARPEVTLLLLGG